MKQSAHIASAPLRRALARDAPGTAALMAHARATRRRDLEKLLTFAVRRRLRRTDEDAAVATPTATPTRAEPHTGTGGPRLQERIRVTDDLLRLRVSRPSGFRYRPGQHVKMGVPGVTRTYSLASAPHEAHLEFFVEVFPGGRLSQRLRELEPGAAMALGDRAKGDLEVDVRYPNQLLVATVTGVAPFVSMLRDHLHRHRANGGRRRFVILHGASLADELGYADELAGLARRHPETLTYVPTVSRPDSPRNAGWTGARGRVETQVETLLGRFDLTRNDTGVIACGNPGMVSNVAGAFRRRGFAVQTEPFD